MLSSSRLAVVTVACFAICSTAPIAASAAPQRAVAANSPAGTWVGTFAQTEWTFEFKRQGDVWSGQYMSARTKKWIPMQSLVVSAQTVRFGLGSKPEISFNLKVDSTNKSLVGDMDAFGRKMPFSAARKS